MTPAVSLPLLTVDDDDLAMVDGLLSRLRYFEGANLQKLAYYTGKQRIQHLGISIPPALRNIEVAVGWSGTTVDVIEERLDWFGWVSDNADSFGLRDVYVGNALDVDSGKAHLDALIYGTGFGDVGALGCHGEWCCCGEEEA